MGRQTPRWVWILIFLGVGLLLFDQVMRPWLKDRGYITSAEPAEPAEPEAQPTVDADKLYRPSPEQQNLAANSGLAQDLAQQLDGGEWALVIYLPCPQKQGREHDDLLRAIALDGGALNPLRRDNVKRYQYIYMIDRPDPYWVLFDVETKVEKEGYGAIQLYDCRWKKAKLVYSQRFPYRGIRGEFPEGYTPSQVIAREMAITIHRWKLQTTGRFDVKDKEGVIRAELPPVSEAGPLKQGADAVDPAQPPPT